MTVNVSIIIYNVHTIIMMSTNKQLHVYVAQSYNLHLFSDTVQTKGKGESGYYRFLNRFGEYIWIQSRAVVVFDSCSGKPSHMVCTSYVIR